VRTAVRDARAKKALTEGINAQTEVVNLGAEFWRQVMDWGKAERKLSPKNLQIIQICSSIPRCIPTAFQAKHAMELLQRLKEQGFEEG
jgi:hypothetical protein